MDIANLAIKIKTDDIYKAKAGLKSISNEAKTTEKSVNGLSNSFKILGKVAASGYIAKEFVKTADEMSLLNSRLKMTTNSIEEFNKQQKVMHSIARETHSSISDVTDLYIKLHPALKTLGKSTDEINQITRSFAKSLQLGGASAEESSAAIKQFSQAMGSGVLRGDEFNTMMEASPKLMRYFAEGMGIPFTALRKMAAEGKLTAEEISNALLKMSNKIDEDFKQMPLTVGKALTDLRTEMSLLVSDIDLTSGATQKISTVIIRLTNLIENNGKEIVTFGKHFGILALSIGGAKVAMFAFSKITKAEVVTSLRLLIANLIATKVSTEGVKTAFVGLKTAFKTFLPTAIVFGGFEMLISYLDKSKHGADNLTISLSKTREELEKMSNAQLENRKIRLTDELLRLDKEQEAIQEKIQKTIKFKKSIVKNAIYATEEQKSNFAKENDKAIIEQQAFLDTIKQKRDEIEKAIDDIQKTKDKLNNQNTNNTSNTIANKLKEELDKKFGNITTLNTLKKNLAETEAYIQTLSKSVDGLDEKDRLDFLDKAIQKREELQKRIESFNKKAIKGQDNINNKIAEQKRAEEEAHRLKIQGINEALQLKDREFDLQRRSTNLITDEFAKNQELLQIEHQRSVTNYKALLEKGEITKEYYKNAMDLEEKLYQKQKFDNSKIGVAIKNGMSSIESAMTSFFDYSSDRFMKFGDLASSILNDIANQLMKILVIQPLVNAIGGGISGFFSGGGTTLHSMGASVFPYAQGGVFSSPNLSKYRNSIVDKPTFFAFASGGVPNIGVMGEKNGGSAEAIMPLTRTSNGDLGVKAQGSNMKIEVINQTTQEVQVTNVNQRQNMSEQVISIVIEAVHKNKMGLREVLGGNR